MSVFVTQTLNVILDTQVDITTASELYILYQQPNGTEGSWVATKVDGVSTKLESEQTLANDQGLWTFQAKIVVGGNTYYGEKVTKYIADVLDN